MDDYTIPSWSSFIASLPQRAQQEQPYGMGFPERFVNQEQFSKQLERVPGYGLAKTGSQKDNGRFLAGTAVDYEGMLNAFAMKYGTEAALMLANNISKSPKKYWPMLVEAVSSAGREQDAMNERERNRFSRVLGKK